LSLWKKKTTVLGGTKKKKKPKKEAPWFMGQEKKRVHAFFLWGREKKEGLLATRGKRTTRGSEEKGKRECPLFEREEKGKNAAAKVAQRKKGEIGEDDFSFLSKGKKTGG